MYKIATILRATQFPNIFRRTLLNAFLEQIGDEYLLCSGFFQEKKYNKSSYYASNSFINNSPKWPCRIKITTVGVYGIYTWGSQYHDFTNAISTIRCPCGVPLKVERRKPKTSNKWHAKVFIVRNDDRPLLAIVGSSNITKNAFDEQKGWNRECDSIIWNTKQKDVDLLVRQSVSAQFENEKSNSDKQGKQNEIVVSSYDDKDSLNTKKVSMDIRLNYLWNEIIDESVVF